MTILAFTDGRGTPGIIREDGTADDEEVSVDVAETGNAVDLTSSQR